MSKGTYIRVKYRLEKDEPGREVRESIEWLDEGVEVSVESVTKKLDKQWEWEAEYAVSVFTRDDDSEEAKTAAEAKVAEDFAIKDVIIEEIPDKDILTKIKINKMYRHDWFHISRVLGGYIYKLPKQKKGAVGRFIIKKPLPSPSEFNALMTKYYTTTAESLFEEACDEIEDLTTGIEEWKDNIEENFSGTEKYEALEECHSQLENFDKPDWPDGLEDAELPVVYIHPVPKTFRGRVTSSRASRLGEACAKMDYVTEALETYKNDVLPNMRELADELGEKKEAIEDKNGEIESLRSEAQEIRDAWEEYETDKDDFEENSKDPDYPKEALEEPTKPEQSIEDAEALDREADDIETEKDELELNLGDWCNQNNIDSDEEYDPDDIENTIDSFISELENGKDEVEAVEFPGMFG